VKRGGTRAYDGEALEQIDEVARLHETDALASLTQLARIADSESVRVAAIREILDRAHERPGAATGERAVSVRHVLVDDGYGD